MHPASPQRIQPLSTLLANQIAAGEVVERPASVVKELLENSIDAGAARIVIDVEEGGARLIRVRDDGHGIHPDDLALALSPHATSKLRDQADLERVASLGFRGEALASIASVSRLRLVSRLADADTAWAVDAEGGVGAAPQPAPHPQGTTVEVRDLFFNTPARRKFLRSERTELYALQEVVKRIALSRIGLSVTLNHAGRALLRVVPAQERAASERRLGQLVGPAFLRDAVALDLEAAGLRLWGWLAKVEAARPQADIQYFFVNGRTVRDRLVGHALRHAHRHWLPEGRHPAYVLFLELDPGQVDVNVHPTKHEVRFRDTRRVHDFLVRAVTEALTGLRDGALEETAAAEADPAAAREYAPAPPPAAPPRVAEDAFLDYARLFPARESPSPPPALAPPPEPAALRFLTVFGAYLLADWQGRLVVVDGVAATRCLVRRLLGEALRDGAVSPVPLLVPRAMRVDKRWAAMVEEWSPALARLGIEIARLGPDKVVVRALPYLLRNAEPEPLALELLGLLADENFDERAAVECMARHAGERPLLESGERDRLLREVAGLPEGRCGDLPVWRQLDEPTLAAWIGERP